MAELMLMKAPGGHLVPATDEAAELISKWKLGQGVKAKVTRARDLTKHRKFFVLIGIGFDAWEPPEQEHNGLPVVKNRERFRKDCLIAAGYYTVVANLRGEPRAEALSMAFDAMDDDEFNQCYSRVVDVLLQKVLRNYTRDDLDRVVEELLRLGA